MGKYVEPADFVAYVESRGYRAEPILNTTEVGMDGAPPSDLWLYTQGTARQQDSGYQE